MRALLLILALCSLTGTAQVRLEVELGWDGLAVAGEVNPLWVEAINEGTMPISGDLVVYQRVGSDWRGESVRCMRKPLALGPSGRTRLVLPWPLGRGGEELTVSFESEREELSAVDVPVTLAAGPVRVHVGRPARPVEPGTVVLHPDDLPADPLLYAAVAGIEVGNGVAMSAPLQSALDSWQVMVSGEHGGSGPVTHPSSEELRDAFGEATLGGSLWWWYLVGAVGYVLVVVWLLGRWGRGRRRWAPAVLALLASGLALFSAVWPSVPLHQVLYTWVVQHAEVPEYELAWSTLFSRRDREVTLDGLWVDRPVVDDPLAGRDLRWTWGATGWRTHVSLTKGQPRILWSFGPRQPIADMEEVQPEVGVDDPIWARVTTDMDVQNDPGFLRQVSTDVGTREVKRVLRWPQDS
ncbi:MAG: hypothetical protein R6U88_05430 [Candidatus Bipolaricaulota bacterium]